MRINDTRFGTENRLFPCNRGFVRIGARFNTAESAIRFGPFMFTGKSSIANTLSAAVNNNFSRCPRTSRRLVNRKKLSVNNTFARGSLSCVFSCNASFNPPWLALLERKKTEHSPILSRTDTKALHVYIYMFSLKKRKKKKRAQRHTYVDIERTKRRDENRERHNRTVQRTTLDCEPGTEVDDGKRVNAACRRNEHQ